jgi:hypothetical protein
MVVFPPRVVHGSLVEVPICFFAIIVGLGLIVLHNPFRE